MLSSGMRGYFLLNGVQILPCSKLHFLVVGIHELSCDTALSCSWIDWDSTRDACSGFHTIAIAHGWRWHMCSTQMISQASTMINSSTHRALHISLCISTDPSHEIRRHKSCQCCNAYSSVFLISSCDNNVHQSTTT